MTFTNLVIVLNFISWVLVIKAFKQLQHRLRFQKRVGEKPFAYLALAYSSACTCYLIYVLLLSDKKIFGKNAKARERGVNV